MLQTLTKAKFCVKLIKIITMFAMKLRLRAKYFLNGPFNQWSAVKFSQDVIQVRNWNRQGNIGGLGAQPPVLEKFESFLVK